MTRTGWLPAVALAAICCTGPAGERPQEGPPPPPSPELAQADSLYTAGQFATARSLWQDALQEAWARGDSAAAARLLTSIGLASRNLGEYPASREAGEQALALKQRLDMRTELFRSYNALGLLAWDEGRLDDAVRLFGEAQAAAEAVADRLGVAKAANNLGLVQGNRGEPLLAREGIALLRDVSREAGDTVSLGRALLNLAMIDLQLGDPLAAIAEVEEARRLARAIGDTEAEENALGQMATAYAALGQPQRAFAAIDSALAIAVASGLRRREAENLKLLGDYYAAAGDHRRALDQYARAQVLNLELGLPAEEGGTLRDQARSYRALGHADTAFARATRARAIHREGGFRTEEFDDQLLLAELAADRADAAGSAAAIDEARQLALDMGIPLARTRLALTAARIHDRARQSRAVLAALDSAGGYDLLTEDERWEPDALRGRAYARTGRLDAAEMAGRRATGVIERIRAAYGSGALRTSYLAGRSGVYADLVVTLLAAGQAEAAFEVADAARGRALLEHLGAARREAARGGGPASDLIRGEILLRRIDELTAQLRILSDEPPPGRGAAEAAQTRSLEDRLAEARAEYEAVLSRIAVMAPGEATLLGASRMRTAEVLRVLRPDEVLVEYLVSADRLHVFVLGGDGLAHVSQPIEAAQLASRVRLARELTARPDHPGLGSPVLSELHRLLIEPVREAVPLEDVRRLIIVPHGPLAYLPFAALLDGTGEPLVLTHSIMVLPSAASLPALRDRDPGGGSAGVVAFAPLPRDLPASRNEAEDVRRILGGRAVVGRRATEAAVREALGSAAVVHMATHGIMNPVNPMFTRLELAAGVAGRPEDDGRLEVHELLGLRMPADLVFLSGCETAKGAAWRTGFEQGEDYVTLAQAFLYAGARNVVATLWRVEDPAAAHFARSFYQAFGAHHDPITALAEAQRAMLRDPEYRAPYYWAAYQVSGSGGTGSGTGSALMTR